MGLSSADGLVLPLAMILNHNKFLQNSDLAPLVVRSSAVGKTRSKLPQLGGTKQF